MDFLIVKQIIIFCFHQGKTLSWMLKRLWSFALSFKIIFPVYFWSKLFWYNLLDRCARCDGAILDKCVSALDKTWHPECFVCGSCGDPFGVSIYFYISTAKEQIWLYITFNYQIYSRMMVITKKMAKPIAKIAMQMRLLLVAVDVLLPLSTIISPLLVNSCFEL